MTVLWQLLGTAELDASLLQPLRYTEQRAQPTGKLPLHPWLTLKLTMLLGVGMSCQDPWGTRGPGVSVKICAQGLKKKRAFIHSPIITKIVFWEIIN